MGHITDWYPGRVSKGYKDNYGDIVWEKLETESPTDETVKDEENESKQ